jgi:hypothetical protein
LYLDILLTNEGNRDEVVLSGYLLFKLDENVPAGYGSRKLLEPLVIKPGEARLTKFVEPLDLKNPPWQKVRRFVDRDTVWLAMRFESVRSGVGVR